MVCGAMGKKLYIYIYEYICLRKEKRSKESVEERNRTSYTYIFLFTTCTHVVTSSICFAIVYRRRSRYTPLPYTGPSGALNAWPQ